MIHTAETKFHDVLTRHAREGLDLSGQEAALPVVAFWNRQDRAPFAPTETVEFLPAQAHVNAGRWIVRCPCGGAQYASRNDHRYFCIDCLNVGFAGMWRRVVWPDNADEIEAVLLRRPIPGTRSWEPGQTIADLLAENAEHGVPT